MKKLMACLVAACAFTAVAEKGDEYVTDKGGGVYEINATTGLTLDDFSDSWTNAFLKRN